MRSGSMYAWGKAFTLACWLFGTGAMAHGPQGCGHGPDTLSALVVYGQDKLLDIDEALHAGQVAQLLDSLCALDPAPADLIRDLRLFQRIRDMDEEAIVQLIDSLFELPGVPYALINEINAYVSEMPGQQAVDDGPYLEWHSGSLLPGEDIYGPWRTDGPNTYGPGPPGEHDLVLTRLVDEAWDCGFVMPVPGVITSRFGRRDGRAHNGIDLALRTGDPVRSAFPGVVRFSGHYGSYGRIVVVRHWNGLETYYAHLHRTKVKVGEEVGAGTVIGLGGNTGRSTGPHLHLEVRFKGAPIDPSRLIDLSTGEPACETLVLRRTRWGYAAYPLGTRFHTVRKGEHLYGIAERYGTSIDTLCELNGISRRSILRVGQRLMVTSDVEGL